ncbi:pyridoxal phosphate-dependent aminotransferase [Anaerotalea alkaliphila]|uniref:Aminotransferase class I/II-fold pyridoxal phosphate-dependent enzyme n=1 Tax=Anaerotalea alkaliphila TaxID=2662126 RepID=A0A7X5HXC5_9FIRM|nr:threonine-phosphate decarboxylase [Anaerotalea alkaliphila]NDL68348.1 aminotransferase class I/II-fold pyridoxal phosphate-dependent enzyme [Anaerotalea alkaliphila]
MAVYTHGGDIFSLNEKGILDFSANINPFGLPQGVREAIIRAVDDCNIYPDPFCGELKGAIARLEGVAQEYLFCSNGAADLIYRLVSAVKPKRALLAVPSFTEYESALKNCGCRIEYFYMREEEEFTLTRRFLDHLTDEIDMVFLCNPNNPTGHVIEHPLLIEIVSVCRRKGILAVIDECFTDFLENSERHSLKKDISENKNVVILKAFTKLYAMAGIRLGYCISSDESIMERLYTAGQPWAVSHLAQCAGVAAAGEDEYLKRSLSLIRGERERLKNALTGQGFTVFDSRANFIFFKTHDGIDLKEYLLTKKILIRSCENYQGLAKGYYRIAVRKPDDNDCFINSLRKEE